MFVEFLKKETLYVGGIQEQEWVTLKGVWDNNTFNLENTQTLIKKLKIFLKVKVMSDNTSTRILCIIIIE